MQQTILIALGIFLISFRLQGQTVDNKLPMYGEVEKSKEYQQLDDNFIKAVIQQFGSREKAYEAHIKFGFSYFYHDSLIVSMKRFNQAWLLNPEAPETYLAFAALTELKGNQTEADRLYQLAFTKKHKKETIEATLLKIADCEEHIRNIEATITTFNKIIQINPKNAFAYKKLGYFYSGLGKNEAALESYNKAIALDSKDVLTYNNRGYLYQKIKNYEQAIIDYSHAIALDPKYISAYVNRGLSKNELHDYTGAKLDFETSVALDPESPELKKFLGFAKYNLKDIEGACAEFKAIQKMGYAEAEEWMKEIHCN